MASPSQWAAVSASAGVTGPCRSSQRSASSADAEAGSASSEADKGWNAGSRPAADRWRTIRTPWIDSSPGS